MNNEQLQVWVNSLPHRFSQGDTLADVVQRLEIKPPFAAAVNLQFVPNNRYTQTLLHTDDRIELISPVTGG